MSVVGSSVDGVAWLPIAADTYTSVLPQLARQSAEDVAALIRPATPAGPRRATVRTGSRRPRAKASPASPGQTKRRP